ncbi:protein of unknown function [Tenacibaculum sp. 190130A14a]|uniref:DUF4348 domain-containing protein n=1 Tax=Tenacibaculum polynesiense TaxID=3137857 RepID=A0ABP1F2J1_9FLAO
MKKEYLIILVILFFACVSKNEKAQTVPKKQVQISVPKNVDSDFKLFLKYFSKDSAFQMSRVHFPVKIKDFQNSENELKERLLGINEYRLKEFYVNETSEKEIFEEYEQTIILENDSAIIEINGIENGIAIDFEFKKVNGKWKLITWTDQST